MPIGVLCVMCRFPILEVPTGSTSMALLGALRITDANVELVSKYGLDCRLQVYAIF